MTKKEVVVAALEGFGFYLSVPQIMRFMYFLSRKMYVLGLIADPDGSYTYIGLWFRLVPAVNFFEYRYGVLFVRMFNLLFWAIVFVILFWLWDKGVDSLVRRKVIPAK